MLTERFSIGDRVAHLLTENDCRGTIEHIGDKHVRIRWDDGKVGLMYDDDSMLPNARYLQVLLRAPKTA